MTCSKCCACHAKWTLAAYAKDGQRSKTRNRGQFPTPKTTDCFWSIPNSWLLHDPHTARQHKSSSCMLATS
jgi:hypothetical protein